jgi:voltage-gated potassium channel Kch
MPQSFLFALFDCGFGLIGDVLHFFIAIALLFLVLSTFLRPVITSESGKRITKLVEYRGPILIGLLLGGLIFGTIGNFLDQYSKLNNSPIGYLSSDPSIESKSEKRIDEPEGLSPYWSDKFYLSWTQFFADGTVTPRDSFWTRIGRMMGLTFVSLLAYEAYTKLFAREILDSIIKRQRDHTLICGSGRIGTVLAKKLLQDKSKNHTVTVIEKDPSSPSLDELRELGANVMIADATLRRNLERARCDRAKEIFVVTGSDEANLDIAADVIYTFRSARNDSKIPKIYVHLNQMRLERIISELIEKDDNTDRKKDLRNQIAFFNPLEESMRDLFDDEVILRRPKQPDQVAHYVIVGFGQTGQQLALFLAENAHFENLKRPRMTIVYRSEEQLAVSRFIGLYPRFFPQATPTDKQEAADDLWNVDPKKDSWEFGVDLVKMSDSEQVDYSKSTGVGFAVNGSFVRMDGGCTSPIFIANLYKLCKQPEVRPMVFLCNADDEENCAEAIELRQVMDERLKAEPKAENPNPDYADPNDEVSVVAYVPDHPSLLRLLNANKGNILADRIAWGDCTKSCEHIRLETDIIKKLADKIQLTFSSKSEDLPFLTAWRISSNRKAAIHLNAKLAVIDRRICSPPNQTNTVQYPILDLDRNFDDAKNRIKSSGNKPQEDQIQALILMAKMEHHRWLAERLLQDWALGPKWHENDADKLIETRRRPSFVDWEKTSEKDRLYNIEQVEKSFEFLREMLKAPKKDVESNAVEHAQLFSINKRTS